MFAILNLSYYSSYILFLKDNYTILSAFDLVYYQALLSLSSSTLTEATLTFNKPSI